MLHSSQLQDGLDADYYTMLQGATQRSLWEVCSVAPSTAKESMRKHLLLVWLRASDAAIAICENCMRANIGLTTRALAILRGPHRYAIQNTCWVVFSCR